MMVAQKMGGYSLGEADVLRRIMGKKKPELLPPEEEKFMKQAVEKGYEKKIAKDVFDKMALFAGYGFNKSHSAAYSVVAYHTMYFKANYPAEYMSAVLSHNMNDIKKVSFFIEECQRMGIAVDPPNINSAEGRFAARNGRIQYGMSAIKGVGSNAIQQIVEEREENGNFSSIFDFSSRIDTKVCNRRTIESLIQAGAFDTLHGNRASLLESIEDILNYASRKQEEARLNQANLFGNGEGGSAVADEPRLRDKESWTTIERLNRERELIGFYLSGHPLDKYREDIYLFASHSLEPESLNQLTAKSSVKVIGIITAVKEVNDRKGRPFAFIQLEDLKGSVEVIAFNDVYDQNLGKIQTDTIVMLEGQIDKRDAQAKIIARRFERVENLREKFQDKLELTVNLHTGDLTKEDLHQMASLFSIHQGNTPIKFQVHSKEMEKPLFMNVRKFVVEPNNELLDSLRDLVGEDAVGLVRSAD